MRALKIIEKEKVEIINNDSMPSLGNEEAIVRISHISLCGSDYKLFSGNYSGPLNYPIIFGHEWSGTIVAINSKISSLKPGDKVTGDCSRWGNNCEHDSICKMDKNICTNIEKYGISIDGFAQEYANVPVRHLYPAPAEIDMRVLALSELFAVALNGIKKAGREYVNHIQCCKKQRDSRKTLIIGAGALGISLGILLKYMFNDQRAEIYDISADRVDLVKAIFSELEFIKLENTASSKEYAEIFKTSSYDLIFEASGSHEAVNLAFERCKAGGTVVLLGMYPPGTINMNKVVLKAINVIGSIGGTGSFNDVIPFLHANQEKIVKMITRNIKINEIESFDIFIENHAKRIKTQLFF